MPRRLLALALPVALVLPAAAPSATARDAAVRTVEARGYTPTNLRQYKRWATLRVLTGSATGAATPYNNRAFFFVGRRFIGTDTANVSRWISYRGQTRTTVRLRYRTYGPGDGQCCPSGARTVRYHWNGRRLVPLDRIPSDAER